MLVENMTYELLKGKKTNVNKTKRNLKMILKQNELEIRHSNVSKIHNKKPNRKYRNCCQILEGEKSLKFL